MILAAIERRAKKLILGSPSNDRVATALGLSSTTKAGTDVSEFNAYRHLAVFAAVRVIAETMASLPLFTYRRLSPRGKEPADSHPLFRILHDAPNPECTSMQFREAIQAHVLTWGNGYAEIERDVVGRPIALWPITPERVEVERDDAGRIVYRVQASGRTVTLRQESMLHIAGLGWDGVVGYSPIQIAREAIGLGLAAQEFGELYFSKGAHPTGVYTHPGVLSPEAQKRLTQQINEQTGLDPKQRYLLLEEGMQWQAIGVPPEDAQFLETRKFQVSDIARLYRVPPHMIGDLDKATFSNIEQQAIDFIVHTLMPWLVRWEQELRRKLLMPTETDMFVEHVQQGLLRGDQAARAAFYEKMLALGAMSPNDIRELENLNPYDEGDGRYISANLKRIDEEEEPPPEAPSPDDDEDDEDQDDDGGDDSEDGEDQDNDDDEGGEDEQRSLDNMAHAMTPAFVDAIRRCVTIEYQQIAKLDQRSDGHERIEAFFGKHEGRVHLALSPLVHVAAGLVAGVQGAKIAELDMDAVTASLVAGHMQRSRVILADTSFRDGRPQNEGERMARDAVALLRSKCNGRS